MLSRAHTEAIMRQQTSGEAQRQPRIVDPAIVGTDEYWFDLFDRDEEVPERVLRCTACGAEDIYAPEHLLGCRAPVEPIHIGDDLECTSCGGAGPFELTVEESTRAYRERAQIEPYGEYPGFLSFASFETPEGPRGPVGALAVLRARAEAAPHSFERWIALARLAQSIGPTSEARAAFAKARSLRPGDIEAIVGLAECLLDSGDPASALRLIQRALRRRHQWSRSAGGPDDHSLAETLWSTHDQAATALAHPHMPMATFDDVAQRLRRLEATAS